MKLTVTRMKELLDYEPNTGIFRWRVRRGTRNVIQPGDIAGRVSAAGYIRIGIDGVKYMAHRLAWLYVHGALEPEIDHKDTIRHHNWIENLRPATRALNCQNQRRANRDSKSGLLGVIPHAASGKWRAQIKIDGKQSHLGYFKTPEEAHAAYLAAKVVLHPFQTLVAL